MQPVRHVYQTYIRTTPERLWQALTSGAFTQQYYYGSDVTSSWTAGAPLLYAIPGRGPMIEGSVLESDPPRKLVHTFKALWDDDVDPPSRVTYEIEPMGASCKLTVVHEHVAGDTAFARDTVNGWNLILSGLKTLLETGTPLVVEEPEAATA